MSIKEKINKITVYLLFLLGFASLLYQFEAIQSLIMSVSCLFLLLRFDFNKSLCTVKWLPFFVSFFILLAINLFYFHTKSIQIIANSFLLFLVPIFSADLYNSPFFLKLKQNIILTYAICISFISIYIIFFYIKDIPNHHFNWYFVRFNLENTIEIHGTYISLWIGIAFLFILDFLLHTSKKQSISKYVLLFILAIYLVSLIIINTRIILYSLPLISFIAYYIKTKQIPQKRTILITFSLFIMVLFLSQRFKNDIVYLYENSIKNSSRYTICYCSLQTIAESNFIGIDNSLIQSKLNTCYEQYGFDELSKNKLNSHNQYLDFFLKGGFILFMTFVATLIIKLRNAYQTKNYLFFSITLLFAFSFLTENVLVRQYGIYIYLFCDIIFLGSVLPNKSHSANEIKEG